MAGSAPAFLAVNKPYRKVRGDVQAALAIEFFEALPLHGAGGGAGLRVLQEGYRL